MNFGEVTGTLESVVKRSLLTEKVQNSLLEQLMRIKRRISDDKIYIGIVGEFSSGKSTLINSLINEDFFRTNALQGTTTTITKLEYGKRINLKIVLSQGDVLKYNQDKTQIIKLYLPDKFKVLSALQKIKIRFLDFFHLNKADVLLLDVFDKITTSNEISNTLEDVTVFYPSDILKEGIVIVDTPGTDSLIPAHAKTTLRALQDVCDIALVITTATQLFPQTLIRYLDDNFGEVTDKCIYIITKIELIRKSVERLHVHKAAVQRIHNFLGVETPQVIMAPSLLSLEESGVIEKTHLTDHLSSEERKTLCSNYKADISQIAKKIYQEKEITIKQRIRKLIDSLCENLQSEIELKEEELKTELKGTYMMRVKPLRDFMDDFYASHTAFQYPYVESRIMNAISSYKNAFKDFVFEKIDSGSTKNETQATMDNPSTVSKGNSVFSGCYEEFKKVLTDTQASYVDNFEEFRTSFFEMFSIVSVDFKYSIIDNPNWQRKYNFSYSKWNLTTFPLLRVFKSLNSIKAQMKSDVGPKIDEAFKQMEKHYVECAKKSYADIAKQMENVKRVFIKKYDRVITKRVKESYEHEMLVKRRLDMLKSNLTILNSIDFS